ncbi:isochorismate synthase [Auritidibacter ignavus]|uniref:isochorismate synthase n=1 Tax=Auritidibacter ignavus TaxID=678932 RepID=UPI00244D7BDA|nr:isochorismate synthase [Auritidibacter ignavus]WGH83744.1 isochorismate synthase [Auritidibacter ignavus]
MLYTLSVAIDPAEFSSDLSALLATDVSAAWVREGYGTVGWGITAQHHTNDAQRFQSLASWWSQQAHTPAPGTHYPVPRTPGLSLGMIPPRAMISATFDARSATDTVALVPEVLLIHTPGISTLVWQLDDSDSRLNQGSQFSLSIEQLRARWRELQGAAHLPIQTPEGWSATRDAETVSASRISRGTFRTAVGRALDHLETTNLDKVVLSRDLVVVSRSEGFRLPTTASALAQNYPQAWTYLVDGLVGATPELLVGRTHGRMTARVLAGTLSRQQVESLAQTSAEPVDVSRELLEDRKQRFEHQAAVESLLGRLRPLAETVQADTTPYILELPNVWHLATDISATMTENTSVLDLVEIFHPTAAVNGVPTAKAREVIHDLEYRDHGLDRGRYAGPVGWCDATGDGEFGIALRGGVQETAQTMRLFAGGGIVPGSVPDQELEETTAKLEPMLQALGVKLRDSTSKPTQN